MARLRPGIAETVQEAVDALVRAGAVACDFTLPEAEAAYGVFLDGGLSAIELRSFLDRELPEWLDQLDPVIAPAVRNAESLSAREYLARVARLSNLARAAAPRLDGVDVIASPTLCLTPPLMSEVADADSHSGSTAASSAIRSRSIIWDFARLRCRSDAIGPACPLACS